MGCAVLNDRRECNVRRQSGYRVSTEPSLKAGSMPTSEHYRKNAEECDAHARETHDTHERKSLLRMAAQRDRLAEHKARQESEQT